MAQLYDLEKNVCISLTFDKDVVHEGKNDFESWILFVLELTLDKEKYFTSKGSDSLMNFSELKNFISGISAFIKCYRC